MVYFIIYIHIINIDYSFCLDHILTLQHALAHYERMLSQSHPTYLSQLRVTVMTTKSGQDKAIMLLTIVSMAVLCNLAMIGMLHPLYSAVIHHNITNITCRSFVHELQRPN